MNNKVAVAISAALISVSPNTFASPLNIATLDNKDRTNTSYSKNNVSSEKFAIFKPESNLSSGKHRYFIQLQDSPVALYQGANPNYAATIDEKQNGKLNIKAISVVKYRGYLQKQQQKLLSKATSIIDSDAVKQQTTLAFNGLVVEMTQEQAKRFANLPGIAHIKRETLRYLTTDAGPTMIKAPAIWNGATTGMASKGEGKIIGIIDTGINTDNASFADVGDDGYDHTNPWGANNYSGDCSKAEWKHLCNDKLIGVHSYPLVTDQYAEFDDTVPANGEDHNGHGSHVAGTAAGNVLLNRHLPNVIGEDSGVVFEQLSGVAPHANIVSYQVCKPGEDDSIGFAGCYPSLAVLAVEHAIENGIDALNYSIGGGSTDPWRDPDALSFLAARKAGIHVATSAGNDGPDPQTVGSPGDAPWITTVAAYTHSRVISDNNLSSFEGGNIEMPAQIEGQGLTGGVNGHVVYAGNYPNVNDPDGDPAQCLQPYPADTFAPNTIVVCDRGSIARVDKGKHVKSGGASGLILANIIGGANDLANDAHVLPAIHINANDGESIRNWLASGEGHTASIAGRQFNYDESKAKIAADFTSRGPNGAVPNIIKPSIAAPGVNIYASYADNQSDGFKQFTDAADFAYLSGTSMASPHIAGALTLLSDIRPSWTPAQVQSALMLTADQLTTKEDGDTPSDFFDMGAGYANLEAAAQTGLVMDETFSGYMQANPLVGGSPEDINLATMANANCVDICRWTRTLTATKDASWHVTSSTQDGLVVTVSPASFTLGKGQSQEITITADVTNADADWNFANVVMTSAGLPEIKLPMAAKANDNNLPSEFVIQAQRNSGEMTFTGLKSKTLSNIDIKIYEAAQLVEPFVLRAAHEKWAGATITLNEDVAVLHIASSNATSPDFDLEFTDSDQNLIASSATSTSNESITLHNVSAGEYIVWVYNFEGSKIDDETFEDEVTINIDFIQKSSEAVSTAISADVIENNDDFSITFNWNSELSVKGLVELSSALHNRTQDVLLTLNRVQDDVDNQVGFSGELIPGESQNIVMNIAPNFSDADKVYQLSASLPQGQQVGNISHNGVLSNNSINWTITRKVGESPETLPVSFEFTPRKGGTDYTLQLTNTLGASTSTSATPFTVKEVAPIAIIQGPSNAKEGTSISLNGESSYDDNHDDITYRWTKTSGPNVSFDNNSPNISFISPAFNGNMTFELQVSDTNGNVSTTTKTITIDKKSSGGAFTWLLLMLVPLISMRTVKKN